MRVRLGEVCEINMGQSPASSTYNEEEKGLPFFQGNADFGEIYPTARIWCDEPTKVAHIGDILISVRAPIGALNLSNCKCCIGRGLAALTVNKNICLQKYLWYVLAGKNGELNSKGTGSTFKAINKNILAETEIPLPSLDEQHKIVMLLDKVSGVIAERRKQVERLDDLVKSRFIEMFGDPVANPHGFKRVTLSELAEIKIGPFGSLLHKEDYIEGGHPLLNPSHIIDGKVAPDSKLTISDKKYAELEAYHLHVGDVIMGRRGEMGRCAVVPYEGFLCGTGSLLIRVRGEVTADYIQKIISFPSFKKAIEDMAVGQTMPNLNVPIVSRFQIIKPPVKVQNSYYTFVKQTDKLELVAQKSLEKLEILKKSLMQQYFG